jgi:NAD(P)-dependent dehydrogenase (short-subunit alcohol dehydrogenase family)
MSDDDWRFTIRNELDLVFFVTSAAWPYLVANDAGVIINVASVQGHIGTPFSGGLAHAASKAGVAAMNRQMATEGAPHGIRAISISPGPIFPKAMSDLIPAEMAELLLKNLLVKRFGEPDEVVALACFLASDQAAYITGTDIIIDGGLTTI